MCLPSAETAPSIFDSKAVYAEAITQCVSAASFVASAVGVVKVLLLVDDVERLHIVYERRFDHGGVLES